MANIIVTVTTEDEDTYGELCNWAEPTDLAEIVEALSVHGIYSADGEHYNEVERAGFVFGTSDVHFAIDMKKSDG